MCCMLALSISGYSSPHQSQALNKVAFVGDSVVIGKQVWMVRNLDLVTFRNGDTIIQAQSAKAWKKALKEEKPAWCYYQYDTLLPAIYGKLYNDFAISDERGLAPEGWHIPDDQEFNTLVYSQKGEDNAAESLKSEVGWRKAGKSKFYPGNNSSGFDALPGGMRMSNGQFMMAGIAGYYSAKEAWEFQLFSISPKIFMVKPFMLTGLSVRCVKD